jgi:cell division protein FtsB
MKRREVKKISGKKKAPSLRLAFTLVLGMTMLLGLTINYRAYQTMRREAIEHEQLNEKAKSLTDENLQLQEEINDLKTDRKTVEREAKRLGIPVRSNQ